MSRNQTDDVFTFTSYERHTSPQGLPRVQLVCQVLMDAFPPVLFGSPVVSADFRVAGSAQPPIVVVGV